MSMLPIFLKLDSRRCLLVGAGNVALEKITTLLKTGLQLRVIAPNARPEIQYLAGEAKLEWIQRTFLPSDLDGNTLVIAATDIPEVNALVYRESVARGILANSVDDIPNCDFFFGSVVSRGNLQIAISTAGESPAVAQRLRREIDEQLPADLGPWLENLGRLRREILATHPRSESRKLLLHQLANRPLCESTTCPSRQLAQTKSEKCIDQNALISPQEAAILSDRSNAEGVEGPASSFAFASRALTGTVYLVGAGPGDPDLLTVKALRLIQSAQVILHDDLVAQSILDLAPLHAKVVNVGKRCGTKTITQEEINALMIEHARTGSTVVRLKSGDPLIFGRAAEEMAALAEAEVSYTVVPGITAAFAAAAAIGCSLTDRYSASNVTFSTGHHASSHNQSPLPEIEDSTRVVYMPGRDLQLLAQEWLQQGLPADFPCAVVSRAAQPGQQVRCTTLAALGDAAPTTAPSLLIAGWAVRDVSAASLLASISESVTV
jgi:uroporphyrin-III C-methyltransferase / precorrin-2 dehydrogenase / sirohydrochlorin ferrochelatase